MRPGPAGGAALIPEAGFTLLAAGAITAAAAGLFGMAAVSAKQSKPARDNPTTDNASPRRGLNLWFHFISASFPAF
jgi:hypothetical protein